MAFNHRLPAICVAVFSSVGVLLAAFAGSSCSFLYRVSDEENIFDNELQTIGSFGVLCEHEIFPRDGDKMWEISRIFLIVGLSLGSLTAALAWAVASFLTPTDSNWNGISILAALTAVIQVPIFVLFEAQPCIGELEDIDLFSDSGTGLGCELGPGAYLLIVSDLLFIAVTVITQCFDRPRWGLDMDVWNVFKKGQSYKKGKKTSHMRNDEYYYDDNENYDDKVHLTSLRAKSVVSSEGDDENAFYKISRVLPAGEAKKEQAKKEKPEKPVGFFAKLFGKSSSVDDMEVPVGKTKSMDDEYDYESQLLHNLEIVRVLPQANDSVPPPTPSPSTVQGEGEEVSIGAFDKVLATQKNDANNRSVQSFEPIVENGTKLIPWMPSAAVEGNGIGIGSPLVEQHQMIDSPGASLLCMETNMQEQPIVSSVTDILNDLRCEEIAADPYKSKSGAGIFAEESPASISQDIVSQDTPSTRTRNSALAANPVVGGVKQFTKKLKTSNSKRPSVVSSIRNLGIFNNRKGAYCQMSSDRSSDDCESAEGTEDESGDAYFSYYDETDVKPPLQLQYADEDFNPHAAVDLSALSEGMQQESEVQHIYDELNQDKDGVNSITQDVQNTPIDPFAHFETSSIGSTHSDPGPISFEAVSEFSFGTGSAASGDLSFMDLLNAQTEFETRFPNDDSLDDYDGDYEENSRGRSVGRNDGRRRRRPISPVGSIKSHTSLLHMTIDEETEEDIKKELDPTSTYSLKRTLSSPELGSGPRPITSRRDKSTNELLQKLHRLKSTMHSDSVRNTNRSELPPLSPRKEARPNVPDYSPESNVNKSSDGSFVSVDDGSAADSQGDEASAILSDLLSTDVDAAKLDKLATSPKRSPVRSPMRSQHSKDENKAPSEPQDVEKPNSVPTKLVTSENESWKDMISPMKDTPKKENWKDAHTPTKDFAPKQHWKKPGTPGTADISDETSETGETRSTISYDSDDSSASGREPHFRRTRSKSAGRSKKDKKSSYRTSSSLSPSRRKSEDRSCMPISSLARESRIRRLQQLRKGYMPLDNSHERAESPKPYRRDPYDPADPELTPKRKTAVPHDRDEIMSAASTSEVPNELFQPSLLDPDEPCPEFDNILDQLDLQLIDLNRPLGAEYGDDEGSM